MSAVQIEISNISLDMEWNDRYFVNTMNKKTNDTFLEYQSQRLQDLIGDIVDCCEDRKLYESQAFGLPYAEIKCLMLFNGEHYLTVKGIAERLDVAKSRVTKLVDHLVEKKILDRIDDPKDARIKLISMTPEGKRKLQDIKVFHQEIHKKILLHVESEERKNILSSLERLRATMEEVKETFI